MRAAVWFKELNPEMQSRLLAACLAVIGAGYYSLYFRSGFNLADEGNVALLSKMLLEGKRPFLDVALNYNLLWFYPIVALFKVFGVSLVVMKVYFFTLALITALFGYLTVNKVTGKPWLAFLAGLLLVAIPGTPYRTYIPLLAVANGYLLARAALLSPATWNYWMSVLAGAVALGLTFLVRVEVGLFFSLLWVGLTVCRVFDARINWIAKALYAPGNLLLIALVAWLVHVPVYRHAQSE